MVEQYSVHSIMDVPSFSLAQQLVCVTLPTPCCRQHLFIYSLFMESCIPRGNIALAKPV